MEVQRPFLKPHNRVVYCVSIRQRVHNANITYYGTLASASDKRLKEDIEDVSLDDCQTLFNSIMPKSYERIDAPLSQTGKHRLGFTAQDVQSALLSDGKFVNLIDTFMHGPEDGEKEDMVSVSYDRMALVLWGVVKNQQNNRRYNSSFKCLDCC